MFRPHQQLGLLAAQGLVEGRWRQKTLLEKCEKGFPSTERKYVSTIPSY